MPRHYLYFLHLFIIHSLFQIHLFLTLSNLYYLSPTTFILYLSKLANLIDYFLIIFLSFIQNCTNSKSSIIMKVYLGIKYPINYLNPILFHFQFFTISKLFPINFFSYSLVTNSIKFVYYFNRLFNYFLCFSF